MYAGSRLVYLCGKLPGMPTNQWRLCSSISTSIKTPSEASKGFTVEEQPTAVFPNGSLDIPPVLYIAKYNRLIETSKLAQKTLDSTSIQSTNITNEENTAKANWSPQSLTERKVHFIVESVRQTATFELLFDKLNSCPASLFESPPKVYGGRVRDIEFVDHEMASKTAAAPSAFVLKPQKDEELLLWTRQTLDLRRLPTYYLMLSKFRLTLLVCATSAAGFCLAPAASFDPTLLAMSTIGVGLISASANTINQLMEVPFDSQMNRTKNRVLVRGLLSPRHVMAFASSTAIIGTLILVNQANLLAAGLGLLNLILYTSVYTPMKRISIANTWIGSIVGAIPPLIGWSAAMGSLNGGAFVLAGILYAWQFPHFNSLSWNLRPDYSKAGYRMMSVTNPDLCKRVALRYSLACIAICSAAAPALDVTTWAFALDTLPLNGYLTYLSWRFYQKADSNTSRKLFRYTLIHLPLLMTLMFINRKKFPSESSAEIHPIVVQS